MNNSSNLTVQQPPPPPDPPSIPPYLYRSHSTITVQVIAFAILGVVIILGNLASIITFIKTQSLRKRSNYMLINLSVADFLIAIVVFLNSYYFSKLALMMSMNFQISLEVLDAFTGTSSLVCLTLIAAERFHAVVFPFKHSSLSKNVFRAMCAIPWLLAGGIFFTFIGFEFPQSGEKLNSYLSIRYSLLFIALTLIMIAYFVIWWKSPRANPNNRAMRDKKLSVTLFIVTLASMLTWLPLQCFGFAFLVNKFLVYPHVNYFVTLKLIQYCNSAINFFIYVLRMREFKAGFFSLFCCSRDLRQQTNRMSSANVSTTTSIRQATSTNSITLKMTKQKSYVLNSGISESGEGTNGKHQVEGISFKE